MGRVGGFQEGAVATGPCAQRHHGVCARRPARTARGGGASVTQRLAIRTSQEARIMLLHATWTRVQGGSRCSALPTGFGDKLHRLT
jgi:hypothetical protein